jgi:3-hydroxybutyryl-CoA dehydrogenase
MKVDDIRSTAVVGAGLMGHAIALEFALAGYEVHTYNRTEEKLQHTIRSIRANLRMLRSLGMVSEERVEQALKNIHPGTVLKDVVEGTDVVIESVAENLELKQEIFQELDKLCPEHAILATNSSTLVPSKLAPVTRRPDKVIGTHYFNPPHLLPVVEVVCGPETSDETITTVCDLLTKVGKCPVIVRKEVTGFIGNRLQAALLREALSVVEHGVASPQDVDIVIKKGFGRRYAAAGVFEIFEIAGWDLIYAAAPYLLPYLENSTKIPPLLKDKISRGELGVKTGKGFYEWTPESAEALKQRIGRALVTIAELSQRD